MAAHLVLRHPDGSAVEIPLRDVVVVGRNATCAVRLNNPYLSEVHCQFAVLDGRWHAQDRHSSNGTFVNGERIGASHALLGGDVVSCGPPGLDGVIRFEFVDGPVPEAAALAREVGRLRDLVDAHERRITALEALLARR